VTGVLGVGEGEAGEAASDRCQSVTRLGKGRVGHGLGMDWAWSWAGLGTDWARIGHDHKRD